MSTTLPYQRQFDASTFSTVTESNLTGFRYLASEHENTIVFNRPGEEVNLAVQHFPGHHELNLVVFNTEGGEPTTIHEEINLSYQGARLLRDLLNRPEVAQYLEQDYH
jgi:hypothetical protein